MEKKSAEKKQAIIWLVKQGLYLYVTGHPNIYTYQFPPDAVKYFDISDEAKFILQFENFLKQNKLPPLNYHFIVGADVLYKKEAPVLTKEEIQAFLDLIPYEKLYSKTITKEKSTEVLAFNGEFYDLISGVLDRYEGTPQSVLPYSLLGAVTFNAITAPIILKKADSLKSETMVQFQAPEPTGIMNYNITPPKKEEKSTLPILIPVFIVLILVLVAVIYFTSRQQPATINTKTSPRPSPTRVPSPVPLKKETMLIQISYKPELLNKATSLQTALTKNGFVTVTLSPISGISTQNNSVTFKPAVPADIRQSLMKEVNTLSPGANTREDSTLTNDINIVLAL